MFRNNNPDKGTETVIGYVRGLFDLCLEIITPIRGRKLSSSAFFSTFTFQFRNNTPDKGTETLYRHGIHICFYLCLEIITPIRGWKLEYYEGDNSNEQNK